MTDVLTSATHATDAVSSPGQMERAATRIAALLNGTSTTLSDSGASASMLEFETVVTLRPLARRPVAPDAWAVDGGQAMVADARCLQLVVTRASRVRFHEGACVLEEEGPLRAVVLAGDPERRDALEALALDAVSEDTSIDINLLRDRWEWDGVVRCIDEAEVGSVVLVDGDLQPDWRIPSSFLAEVLSRAMERGVVIIGITKHSSLSRGGAPLLGQLEREAEAKFGPRAMWWAPIARTRGDVGHGGVQVVAARLDPDARFAFRVDLPASVDPEPALSMLSALCDDAAFPGYPYPLSVADRLAACPGWLRAEARIQLDELLESAGVPADVRERAFADRHDLMERA